MPLVVTSDFLRSKVHRASGSGRGKAQCDLACFHGISLERVLNPLVSLMGRLVACSARISVDRQTDSLQYIHRETERLYTVTLTAHARRGLEKIDQLVAG